MICKCGAETRFPDMCIPCYLKHEGKKPMIEEVIDESKTLHGKVYQELRRLAKENRELKDKLNNRMIEIDNLRKASSSLPFTNLNRKNYLISQLDSMASFILKTKEDIRNS